MRHIILTAVSVLALSSAAHAQTPPAPAAGGTPPPAGAAAARPAAPAPAAATPRIGGGQFGGGNTANSAAQARQMMEAKLASRKAACEGKGPAYEFRPPHVVGDANPKGGFWTSNYNGGCKLMSMKSALELGLITMNANARRPN